MNELDFPDIVNNIIKGFLMGFLIAYLIIYGLRPSAQYPDNILDILDNPWIFIILILLNIYIIQWDLTIGLLLLLSIISLILDIIIFTDGEIFNNSIYIDTLENFKDQDAKDDVNANGEKAQDAKDGEKDKENDEKDKEKDKEKANDVKDGVNAQEKAQEKDKEKVQEKAQEKAQETKEGYKNMKNNEKEYKNKIAKIIDNLKDFLKFMRNNNNI